MWFSQNESGEPRPPRATIRHDDICTIYQDRGQLDDKEIRAVNAEIQDKADWPVSEQSQPTTHPFLFFLLLQNILELLRYVNQ